MTLLHLPSPAKINLFLHVVGQREDGYHLLQTAFQFVDLYDEMIFKTREDNLIRVNAPSLDLPVEHNLVFKAAYLLQELAQCKKGIDITLHKRIPLGGGLGGGSSNAATTLLALNHLWGLHYSRTDLIKIGARLGADVPIFIYGKAAFAEGIGEHLQPIQLEEDWILLLFPPCQVATAKIFSDSELTRNTPEITITEFFEKGGRNDCEPIARKHFPEIADAIDCLSHYTTARMTGTGSGVFANFKDKNAALEIANKIPASLNGIILKGLNISPLQSAINKIIGVSPSGKAQGFDPCIPRFES